MAQGGLLHCESWPTLSRHCRTHPTWLWAPWEPDNKWPAGQVKRETEWEYLSGQHNEVHFSWNKGNQQTKGFIYRAVATADKNFIFLNLAKDMQPYKKILKWQTSWDFVSVCVFPFIICICFCVTCDIVHIVHHSYLGVGPHLRGQTLDMDSTAFGSLISAQVPDVIFVMMGPGNWWNLGHGWQGRWKDW